MKNILISFIISLTSILIIDGVWLTVVAQKFYKTHIGHLMTKNPNLAPAIIFYIIYALVITILIVVPAINNNYSLLKTFALGTLLGLAAYSAYDLTNHAILKNWPLTVTLVDILWGTALTGAISLIATSLVKKIL